MLRYGTLLSEVAWLLLVTTSEAPVIGCQQGIGDQTALFFDVYRRVFGEAFYPHEEGFKQITFGKGAQGIGGVFRHARRGIMEKHLKHGVVYFLRLCIAGPAC